MLAKGVLGSHWLLLFQNAQQDPAQDQYQDTSGFVLDIFKIWSWSHMGGNEP